MIDLRHLRTLQALRETDNLPEAAERLHLTQSALSHQFQYSSRSYVIAKRLGRKGLQATLFAAVRSDMLEVPYMSDFLLTAKDISFATLEGVNAVSGLAGSTRSTPPDP